MNNDGEGLHLSAACGGMFRGPVLIKALAGIVAAAAFWPAVSVPLAVASVIIPAPVIVAILVSPALVEK